jgi:hypothetical protein
MGIAIQRIYRLTDDEVVEVAWGLCHLTDSERGSLLYALSLMPDLSVLSGAAT